MNLVHLQQFLPNLPNWTSANQLFQAQLASSKIMEIWETLRFTNRLWNEHNFEYGSSAKLFTIYIGQQINMHFWFMGNGSRNIHTHYVIFVIVDFIHVFSHLRLQSAIKCYRSHLCTQSMMTFKEITQHICPRSHLSTKSMTKTLH